MWYANEKHVPKVENINQELLKLEGSLDDKEARITLAKFLRNNLTFTTELISGIKLAPFQEVTLKGMLNKNFSRSDCLISVGGGITGDIVGFAASLFKEAVPADDASYS